MNGYSEQREKIYRPLREEGVFTWDWLYGQEYALGTPHSISRGNRRELQEATEQLGAIFTKTARVVQAGGAELLTGLGIPAAAMDAVRLQLPGEAVTLIGRFDFVRGENGWKLLEFNSDTPGGVVEAFYVNDKVCDCLGVEDANAGMAASLTEAFAAMLGEYRELGYKTDSVFFSALDWHVEDAGTAKYLLGQSGLDAVFVPLADLRVSGDRLYALAGGELAPVDVLYRLHPLGVLAEDKDTDGYPTGEHVLSLVARRKVAFINPPGALAAQTKALQALVWGLHEAGEFFTVAEQAVIGTYMLPTYLENRFLGRCPYVVKPVLGREGGGVTIFDAAGREIARDMERHYWDQPMVYQQYQHNEPVELDTLAGKFQGRLIWGSFLINGKGSAVAVRAGGYITDDLSYFVPVCLKG
jgi:glutathionylspermidine synthase